MHRGSPRARCARWIAVAQLGLTATAFALLSTPCTAADAALAAARGRPVGDVLRALSGSALQFVFSSQLLPDSLRVGAEAQAAAAEADPVAAARRLLAPHQLTVQLLQPGLYAVVPLPTAAAPPAAAAALPAPIGTSAPPEELREVIVAASRYRIGDAVSPPFSIDRVGLTEQPGPGDDPIRALIRLPGISQDGISAQPNVRGGEAGEVLMLLDGFPLRRAFHLSGYQSLFSVLDAGLIRSAEIFTGGYPARYGNRMAGVFDFQSIRATDEPQHSLGVDFFNASGRTAGHWQRADIDYVASGRIGTLSPLLHAFAPTVGDPRYSDAYLRIDRGDPEVLQLSGNFLWARDELSIADSDRGERAEIEDRLRYLWLRAQRIFSPELTATAWVGQSAIQSFREGGVDSPGISRGSVYDSRASSIWDLRSLVQWQPRDHHFVEGGIEFTEESGRYRYASNASFSPAVQDLFGIPASIERVADLSPRRRRSAFFLAHRWQLSSALTTEIGARAQGIMSSGLEAQWVVEPRVGVRWQIAQRTRLSIGWGQFNQADEVHELKVEDGLDVFPPAQRSNHLIAGIEHEVSDRLSLRAEVFRKRQTDPRPRYENLLNRRTILPEIAPDRVQVLPDLAELDGLELSAEYRHDDWRFWFSASRANADDETAGVHTPRSWDQPWSINTGLRWEHGPWLGNLGVVTHRGFPITALTGSGAAITLGPRNGTRLPDFFQVDVRVQFTQPVNLGSLVYSFEVINASNQPNACCTELLNDARGLYGKTLQGLPLFPSLGLRWNW